MSCAQANGSRSNQACRTRPRVEARLFGLAVKAARTSLSIASIWVERYQQRKLLAELDSHRLADIGVTAEAARREAAKPFWRE